MIKEITCVVCPLGCKINVKLENKEVVSVSGNNCKRGEEYAKNECVNPKRIVTSTVRCADGSVVAVKTSAAIPKENIFECMDIINKTIIDLPISIGDVIIKDVFGCNIIATQNKN